MKYLLFCIAIPVLFVFSCKKKSAKYKISGQVMNTTANQPLSDATIVIETKGAGSSAEYVQYTTVSTDSEGRYSVELDRGKYDVIRLTGNKNLYFDFSYTLNVSSLSVEEENTQNLSTTAKSWVRLILKNNNPQPDDFIIFSRQKGKKDCAECCASGSQTLYGAVNDTIYCINDGNTAYSVLYSSSGQNPIIAEVTTASFDTTQLLIQY